MAGSAMNCPRCRGRLIQERDERWCLMCGYVWYADVIDPEEAKEDHRHGSAVRRPTRREQLL